MLVFFAELARSTRITICHWWSSFSWPVCTKSCPIRYQYSRDGTLTDAFVYTASRKKHVAFLCLNTSVIIKYYRRPLQRSVGPGTIDLDNCVRSFCRWRWKLQEPINQSINQSTVAADQSTQYSHLVHSFIRSVRSWLLTCIKNRPAPFPDRKS